MTRRTARAEHLEQPVEERLDERATANGTVANGEECQAIAAEAALIPAATPEQAPKLPPIWQRRDAARHRERTVEGTRAAVRKRRRRGRVIGATRLGTRATAGGMLEFDPHEEAGIALMLELDAQGLSLTDIAVRLTDEGYRTRRGNVLNGKRVAERLKAQIVPSGHRSAPIPSSADPQTPCPCCGTLHS